MDKLTSNMGANKETVSYVNVGMFHHTVTIKYFTWGTLQGLMNTALDKICTAHTYNVCTKH